MRSEKNNNAYLSGNSLLKKSLIAATGMLFLMSVYAIYWMLMARQSEQSLKNWILERRVEGIDFNVRYIKFKGFPFRLGMQLDDVTIKNVNTSMRTWTWYIPAISTWLSPWRPNHIWFDASGGQNLVIGSTKKQKNIKLKPRGWVGMLDLKELIKGR